MGQIYIYDSLDQNKKVINASGRLKDIFPEYDFNRSVVLVNGERISNDYDVKEDDVIFVRSVPSGTVAVGIFIAFTVIAAGAAIGTAIYSVIQNQKLQKALAKAQKQANADTSTETLPFLKGARNKTALGNSIQYVMGEVFNTPYKLYSGYYTISGTTGQEQYWNAVLSAGFGGQIVKSLSIGDVELLNRASDNAPQNATYPMTEGMYGASQNICEIRNNGEFQTDNFKRKVIAVACGEEVKWDSKDESATPLIKQLEPNAMAVDVEIEFGALRSMDDDGDWNPREVEVIPYWTNDNGSTWNQFTFNQNGTASNKFKYNTSSTIRFIAHKDFTASEAFGKSIQIKLVRNTKKSGSGKIQETVACGYYQTYCYDAKKSSASSLVPCYPLTDQFRDCTTRIGLRFIANDSTSGELDEINIVSRGVARTWNGTTWSNDKTFTRNPAAWILEILTSNIHPHSKFEDSEIDLDSFGTLYEYCESQNFYCDGVLTKETKKRDLISQILEECFSTLIINKEGKLEVCTDKEESIPVALINSQSIISSTVSKSFERLVDGKKVTFVNRDNWQTDTMYVMRDGTMTKSAQQSATEHSMSYATTTDHIFKFAQRALLKESLQTREIKADVGKEGDYYPLYSTVKVQMPQMRIGNVSTVIHAIDTDSKKIKIADSVTFEAGKSYGLIIEGVTDSGRKEFDIPVYGTGTTDILSISSSYDMSKLDEDYLEWGNIASFGELDNGSFAKVTNVMKITGIDYNENGVQLTLRDYNDYIYRWEKGLPIPSFKSNLTSQSVAYAPIPTAPYGREEAEQNLVFAKMQSSAYTDAKIEAAQLEGSPMYSANIDTPVIRKISETEYSPSVINGNCVKQAFDESGTPLDPVANPCNWKVTVNDQYVANILNKSTIAISISDLITQIKADYSLTSLNIKKINIKATSVLNNLVVWDEENIVVLSNDGSYVFELENEYQTYECYSEVDGVTYDNGYIKTARETLVTPHLYNGLTELQYGTDWSYEVIPEVPGFSVSVKQSRSVDGTLSVVALEGADMETEGSIKIPVFIRTTSTIDVGVGYTDDAGNEITVGYSDEGGNEYTIGYLAPDENSGIILLSFSWKKLTETAMRLDNSEKVIASMADDNMLSIAEKRNISSEIDKIKDEYNFNTTNHSALTKYSAYKSAYDALIAYINPLLADMTSASSIVRETFTSKFSAYYRSLDNLNKEISDNPTYTFVKNQVLPSNPKYGDYFLCGKAFGSYELGLIYTYNGTEWKKDNSQEKIMSTMDDALSVLSSSETDSIPAVSFCQKLVAMNAVIKNLMTKVLTLQSGGVIQSQNYTGGTAGFQIKADGEATFRGGTFNNITSDNATFTNASVTGKFEGTGGYILKYKSEAEIKRDLINHSDNINTEVKRFINEVVSNLKLNINNDFDLKLLGKININIFGDNIPADAQEEKSSILHIYTKNNDGHKYVNLSSVTDDLISHIGCTLSLDINTNQCYVVVNYPYSEWYDDLYISLIY